MQAREPQSPGSGHHARALQSGEEWGEESVLPQCQAGGASAVPAGRRFTASRSWEVTEKKCPPATHHPPSLPGLDPLILHLQAFAFVEHACLRALSSLPGSLLRIYREWPRKSPSHPSCHLHPGTPGLHSPPEQHPGPEVRPTPAGVPAPPLMHCFSKEVIFSELQGLQLYHTQYSPGHQGCSSVGVSLVVFWESFLEVPVTVCFSSYSKDLVSTP